MPILASLGAGAIGAYRLFRGGVAPVIPYIEDVFSTYLYTGDSTNRSIVNNIDLSGKGGLVWIKDRNLGLNHTLFDTARGAPKYLSSDSTNAEGSASNTLTAFNSNGFNLGTNSGYVNGSGYTYVSWTFRKQAKFFDVVTYSGNGINGRQISHNLGSTPGTIIVKVLNAADNWPVWHRSAGGTLRLDSSEGTGSFANVITTASSTTFTVTNNGEINGNGYNYVAYIFAHDAGGFGLSGTDNVITCGSFSSTGSGGPSEINLGYEPQWVMLKTINSTGSWTILDNMRGWVSGTTGDSSRLFANLANAESVTSVNFRITSTGFTNVSGTTNYIYIAIRRGPMKTPTSGTSVFGVTTDTNAVSSSSPLTTVPEAIDLLIDGARTSGTLYALPRLTQWDYLVTSSSAAETGYPWSQSAQNKIQPSAGWFGAGTSQINWMFKRAPGFFDVVCYTGTGSATTFNHNLTVVPELMIIKKRNSATNGGWLVGFYVSASTGIDGVGLNDTAALSTRAWSSGNFNSAPTASVFGVSSFGVINALADTYVAYLFATCAGVSKVGSYTGTGTTLQVDCGFTAGSRFVMIKRTDSTGDWYVWDSARGIVAGNDPYLLLNSTAAEVTNTDYIDSYSPGFEISSTAPAAINASGGTYIFLAIA